MKKRIFALFVAIVMLVSTLGSIPVVAADTTYLAFTSDIHNNGAANSNGSGANILTNWLAGVSATVGGTFDTMGFCGDNGDRGSNGSSYWSKVQQVMDVISGSAYVEDDGFFIDGNHEYINGSQSNSQTNATAQKIKNIGDTKVTDAYVVYCFGAASSNQSFNQSDITNLDNYLKTVDSDKPVFVLSHFPIHYYSSRTSQNAQALVNVLNKYPNVIFLWGHNHTLSDSYYDEVYTAGSSLPLTSSSSSKVTINFTYAAAGCMGDDSVAAGVQGEGLVAKINGSDVTLAYYYRTGSVVGTAVTVDVSTGEGGTTTPDTPSNPGTGSGSITQTNSLVAGKSYIIVSNDYALKNNNGSLSAVSYSGTPSDTTGLLWTAETNGSGYSLKNGNHYLNVTSGGSSGGWPQQQQSASLGLNTNSGSAWTYDGTYLSTNSTGSKNYIYYSSQGYFNLSNSTSGGSSSREITLYVAEAGSGAGGNTPETPDTPVVPGNATYTKVTAPTENGKYVIVANGLALDRSNALSANGSSNLKYSGYKGTSVTVSGNAITSTVTDTMIWDVESTNGGYYIKANGQYLKADYSRSGDMISDLILDSSDSDVWSYTTNNGYLTTADNSSKCYLNYYTDYSLFTVRSSGQQITFYKVTGTGSEGGETPDVPETPDTPVVPGNATYTKVTAPTENGKYVIVADGYALDRSGTNSNSSSGTTYSGYKGTSVTVSGNNITSKVTDTMIWDVESTNGGYYIKANGQYLNAEYSTSGNSRSRNITLNNNAESWTYRNNQLTTSDNSSNCYLIYHEDGSIFTVRSDSSATPDNVTFYKVTGTGSEGGETPDVPDVPDVPETPEQGTITQANALENGKSYIIVSNGKALKNNNGSFTGVDYNGAPADTTGLLWTAETNGSGHSLKNGSHYLNVSSGGSSGGWPQQQSASLSLSTNSGSAWSYNNSNSYLTTNVSGTTYYLYCSNADGYKVANSTSGSSSRAVEIYVVETGSGEGGETPDVPEIPDTPVVPGNATYTKVTAPTENGKYVIVANGLALDRSNALSANGSNNLKYSGYKGTSVTVSGDAITSTVTDTMIWDVESTNGGYYIKANGQFLKADYSRSGDMISAITLDSSDSDVWSYTTNNGYLTTADNSSKCYLYYYTDYSLFTVRSSGQQVTFYKVTEIDDEPEGPVYTVSGTVTTVNSETDEVTIELVNGENEVVKTVTVTGNTAEYTLTKVPAGEYTLRISKNANTTREYAVTVAEEDVIQDAELRYIGDVNGDGRVNVGDFNRVYNHTLGTSIIDDAYALSCADVNGDGRINTGDANRIYNHALEVTPLW